MCARDSDVNSIKLTVYISYILDRNIKHTVDVNDAND